MTKPEPSQAAPKQTASMPWPPIAAVAVVAGAYIGASIGSEVLLLIYSLLRGLSILELEAMLSGSTLVQFINVLLIYSLMAGLIYGFVRLNKTPLSRLGVVRPRIRDAGWALLAIPAYILGYLLLLTLATALFPALDVEQEQQLGFSPGTNQTALLLTFASLVILPPLVEEFVMRGFLFTSLLGKMRVVWATIITSVVFAVAHLQFGTDAPLLWVAALDTFVLSVVLCYMRFKTGSLWPGIFLHGLKNLVAFVSIFVLQIN